MNKPIRSTDELFAAFSQAVERMDLIENLMRESAKLCIDKTGADCIVFFADNIGKNVHNMYEYLTEIKLAMDVEMHGKL